MADTDPAAKVPSAARQREQHKRERAIEQHKRDMADYLARADTAAGVTP